VAEIDGLLSRGGMSSMLTTIWLILTALSFGAVLEHGGMLSRLIESALRSAKSTGSLVMTVVLSCIGINVVAADQYIAIVLPGKMYRAEFARRGLEPKNLSRVIEDAGTLTSPLVPWNTCGAYMAAALGVPTLAYLPYAFFNLINPLVSIIYGYTGFTITRIKDDAVPVSR
jgi:NhaC family Na+:H+ antiporter